MRSEIASRSGVLPQRGETLSTPSGGSARFALPSRTGVQIEDARRRRLTRAEADFEAGAPRPPACLCSRFELERYGCTCAGGRPQRPPQRARAHV